MRAMSKYLIISILTSPKTGLLTFMASGDGISLFLLHATFEESSSAEFPTTPFGSTSLALQL